MKTMYIAFETNGPDRFFLGIYPDLEEASKKARYDRNRAGRYERTYASHEVWQLSVPDDVTDKMTYFDALEKDQSIGDGIDCWIVLSDEELDMLADDLDWDPTDKDDTLDSLRTNWDKKLTDDQIEIVYDRIVDNWHASHGE